MHKCALRWEVTWNYALRVSARFDEPPTPQNALSGRTRLFTVICVNTCMHACLCMYKCVSKLCLKTAVFRNFGVNLSGSTYGTRFFSISTHTLVLECHFIHTKKRGPSKGSRRCSNTATNIYNYKNNNVCCNCCCVASQGSRLILFVAHTHTLIYLFAFLYELLTPHSLSLTAVSSLLECPYLFNITTTTLKCATNS